MAKFAFPYLDGEAEEQSFSSASELFANEWSSIAWETLGLETSAEGIKQLDVVYKAAYALQNLHKRVQKCMSSPRFSWDTKVREFRKLEQVWSHVTPPLFVQFLEVLGPESRAFLDSLTVSVPVDSIPALRRQRKAPGKTVTRVTIMEGYDAFPYNDTQSWMLHPDGRTQTDFGTKRSFMRRHVNDDGCLDFSYTTLLPLLRDTRHRLQWTDSLFLINALSHTAGSGAFQTILGRAILTQIWKGCTPFYVLRIILSGCNLIVLWRIGYYTRHSRTPPISLTVLAGIAAVVSGSMPVFEMISACRMYGGSVGFCKYMTQWNSIFVVLEVYCGACVCYIMADVLREYHEHDATWSIAVPCGPGCFMHDHPVFWSFTIMVKWVQFICSLLCWRSVGEHVLPAFDAVFSMPSLYFLFFLMLIVLMTFNGYWCYPIEENLADPGSSGTDDLSVFSLQSLYATLFTFMKVYRLDVIGDSDPWELEGLDPVISARVNRSEGSLEGNIDDPAPNRKWHFGINLYYVAVSMMVSVAFMNVYIGLLSTLYDESKRRTRQMHGHFLAKYIFKVTLTRVLWSDVSSSIRRNFGLGAEASDQEDFSDEESISRPIGGVWISYDKETKIDDEVEFLHEKVDQLMETVNLLKSSGSRSQLMSPGSYLP